MRVFKRIEDAPAPAHSGLNKREVRNQRTWMVRPGELAASWPMLFPVFASCRAGVSTPVLAFAFVTHHTKGNFRWCWLMRQFQNFQLCL